MQIGDKQVEIKELKRRDVRGKLLGLDGEELQDKMLELSTGLSQDELADLTLKQYLMLSTEFNKINGLSDDFQNPQAN